MSNQPTPLLLVSNGDISLIQLEPSTLAQPISQHTITAHAREVTLYHPQQPLSRLVWGYSSNQSLYVLAGSVLILMLSLWVFTLLQWRLLASAALIAPLLLATPFAPPQAAIAILALIGATTLSRPAAVMLLLLMAAALYQTPVALVPWLSLLLLPISLWASLDSKLARLTRLSWAIVTIIVALMPLRQELPPQFELTLILLWQLLLLTVPVRKLGAMQQQQSELNHQLQLQAKQQIEVHTQKMTVQLKRLQDENKLLSEKSWVDPLTGLRNRLFFDEHYRAEVASSKREQTELSLLIVDVDHFKSINDTYGHPIGDKVLQEVAKRLYHSLKRPSDSLCRIGGEEFAVLLPQTNLQGAQYVAENALRRISEKEIAIDADSTISVTISIGIASGQQTTSTSKNTLLNCADSALYQAKRNGRNRIERGQYQGPNHVREKVS